MTVNNVNRQALCCTVGHVDVVASPIPRVTKLGMADWLACDLARRCARNIIPRICRPIVDNDDDDDGDVRRDIMC